MEWINKNSPLLGYILLKYKVYLIVLIIFDYILVTFEHTTENVNTPNLINKVGQKETCESRWKLAMRLTDSWFMPNKQPTSHIPFQFYCQIILSVSSEISNILCIGYTYVPWVTTNVKCKCTCMRWLKFEMMGFFTLNFHVIFQALRLTASWKCIVCCQLLSAVSGKMWQD